MIDNQTIENMLKKRNREDYQREFFDNFLNHIKFNYKVPSIHITGTNGKGSTAFYLSSIYQNAGYKVGSFTSPSVDTINDMILINGKPISNEDFYSYLEKYENDFDKYNISVFEIQTFIAFSYFQDQKCDIAIIECGMGGLLDATNIFNPILSIITSVSIEHTAYLGKSICEIALNKAGIIKENIPVLVGDLSDEALKTISQVALENDSKIYKISDANNVEIVGEGYSFGYLNLSNLYIPTLAKYSIKDAQIAIDAVSILKDQFNIGNENIVEGLRTSKIPLRMEKIHDFPTIYLDGAHNPEAMHNLVESLSDILGERKLNVVFCCFKDKNIERMLANIGSIADSITLTTFNNPRAREEFDYFLFLDEYKYNENCVESLMDYINLNDDSIILITGSFAFAAYMRKLFKENKIC